MKNKIIVSLAVFVFSLGAFFVSANVSRAASPDVRLIYFPTDQKLKFTDNFGDARSGHLHEGTDIMGPKMTPLYSAIDGVVRDLEIPEASWGYAITLEDSDGYTYGYLHVNNDTPGTDDGKGGVDNAYAPFISRGAAVRKGQLIGWMGDSGNAESVGSHLHFEIRRPDHTAVDSYQSLMAALGKTVSGPVQVASTPAKTKFIFKKNLSVGNTNSDVKELQKYLNSHGFVIAKTGAGSPGKETNYFGSATKAALIRFQKAKKISPSSGYFGPLTRSVANK
jgi:murein DD-endopeptidase MepM/ murein hydrolase activator NlpD